MPSSYEGDGVMSHSLRRPPPLSLRIDGDTSPSRAEQSLIATPVVSTEARRAERRDLLSTISRLLWKEGLSAPRFALRSRRRKLPYAIAPPSRSPRRGEDLIALIILASPPAQEREREERRPEALPHPLLPLPSSRGRFSFPQFAQAILRRASTRGFRPLRPFDFAQGRRRMTTTPPQLRWGGRDFPQFAQRVLRAGPD